MNEWYSSNYEFLRYKFWMFLLFSYFGRTLAAGLLQFLYDGILHPYSLSLIFYSFLRFYYTLFEKTQQVGFLSDILQIMVFLMYSLECFSCFHWHWATLLLVSYDSLRCSTVWHWSPKDCEIYSFWKNKKKGLFWALLYVRSRGLQMGMLQHFVVLWFFVDNLWLPFFFFKKN